MGMGRSGQGLGGCLAVHGKAHDGAIVRLGPASEMESSEGNFGGAVYVDAGWSVDMQRFKCSNNRAT